MSKLSVLNDEGVTVGTAALSETLAAQPINSPKESGTSTERGAAFAPAILARMLVMTARIARSRSTSAP